MKKLVILSSISLLTAIMTSSVWAEKENSSTEEVAKMETPAVPAAPTAPEAPAASAPETAADSASKTVGTEEKAATAAPASAEKAASTSDANTPELYIISPKDGEEVSSPVTVVFGLKGMGVAPAGVDRENTGHHHLLIDKTELPAAGVPMGADVIHFGGGQTQAEVELSAGEHSLQLILGDKTHIPISPTLTSEKITIKVK